MRLKVWLSDLLSTVYPDLCEVCGRPLVQGESIMCLHCRSDMPQLPYKPDEFSEMLQRIASPGVPVERAAAYFRYTAGGTYSKLIYATKYHERPWIGERLGRELAEKLLPQGFFDDIDALVPVPMHFIKKMRRGYNQTEEIIIGVASVTGLPVVTALKSLRSHDTQTHKGAFARWVNAENIYAAREERLRGLRHVLVVDDVMTTGSTILSCIKALRAVRPDLRVSVLTLGLTGD